MEELPRGSAQTHTNSVPCGAVQGPPELEENPEASGEGQRPEQAGRRRPPPQAGGQLFPALGAAVTTATVTPGSSPHQAIEAYLPK